MAADAGCPIHFAMTPRAAATRAIVRRNSAVPIEPHADYPHRYRLHGNIAKRSLWEAWTGFCRGLGYQLARAIFRGLR